MFAEFRGTSLSSIVPVAVDELTILPVIAVCPNTFMYSFAVVSETFAQQDMVYFLPAIIGILLQVLLAPSHRSIGHSPAFVIVGIKWKQLLFLYPLSRSIVTILARKI